MEYILVFIGLAILGKLIFKFISKTMIIAITFITPLFLFTIFRVPYIFGVMLCIIVQCGVMDILKGIWCLTKKLSISSKKFTNRHLEKLVHILIQCNYIVFLFLSYSFLSIQCVDNFNSTSFEFLIILIIMISLSKQILKQVDRKLFI